MEEDLAFEIEFFDGVRRREPDNVEVLTVLGHAYTRAKRYAEGLEIDRALARLRPEDPLVHYNLACSQSLTEDVDASIASLEKAVALGYADYEHMSRDPDLAQARDDRRFPALLVRMIRAARGVARTAASTAEEKQGQ